jgi:hypothetical protein
MSVVLSKEDTDELERQMEMMEDPRWYSAAYFNEQERRQHYQAALQGLINHVRILLKPVEA